MREAHFFILDFLFERNEQDVISNIYNPQGSNLHTNCSDKAVNCNSYFFKIVA